MLTAKELVRAMKEVKEEAVESEKRGAKIVEAVGNVNDQEVLARVSAMVYPLTQPRVGIKSSLSEAVWCKDTSRVVIIRNTGKHELGPLCPEEALQLLENNSLLVTRSGVPLSLQAAYTLLLSPVTGVTTTDYLVYYKLARAGYRVITHQGRMEDAVHKKKMELVESVVDGDIDRSLLVPLYGVNLVEVPGSQAPSWLQDIRDEMVPHLHSEDPLPGSQYGFYSWLKDIVEEVVEDAVDCSAERRRKRRLSNTSSDIPCKQVRLDSGGRGGESPKYEVNSSDDEEGDLARVCARCVRRHGGGEEGCLSREKVCQVCGKEGHIRNVHMVKEEDLRRRIVEVLGISEWELWGRFAPEIVTIEEESEDEQIENVNEFDTGADNGDNEESGDHNSNDESETSEINQLYINPFHEEEDELDEDITMNESEEFDLEPSTSDIVVDDTASITETYQKRLENLSNFNSLVGGLVTSQVARARVKARLSEKTKRVVVGSLTCRLCLVNCSNKEQLQSHYQGKSHMKKLKGKAGVAQFSCEICAVRTTCAATLLTHYEGKKHLKAVANLTLKRLSSSPDQAGESPTDRSKSSTPTDDVMIVTDEIRPPATVHITEEDDVEIVTSELVSRNVPSPVDQVVPPESKTRYKILAELPNCFGKSLLILNRPTRNLVPHNTWPHVRHSSFVEVDKLKSRDSENKELDQEMFEVPLCIQESTEDGNKHVDANDEDNNLWCGVCQFGLETDVELLGHVQSELHTRNLRRRRSTELCGGKSQLVETVDIDLTEETDTNEIIVLEDDIPSARRQVHTPLTQPFRGFWSSSEVVRPLASVRGSFHQVINFGFHAKPSRVKRVGGRKGLGRGGGRGRRGMGGEGGRVRGGGGRGREGSGSRGSSYEPGKFRGLTDIDGRGRWQKGRDMGGLTRERVGRGRLEEKGWSRGDLREWVKETEKHTDETQDIAEDVMGVGMDIKDKRSGIDLQDIAMRAKMWVLNKRGEAEGPIQEIGGKFRQEQHVTDVVDLSSSDDDAENRRATDTKGFSFSISDVRSLIPPAKITDDSPSPPADAEPDSGATSARTGSSRTSSYSDSSEHDDVSAHSELRYFKTGPLASLWSYEGSVGPLLAPEMGGSLREVYSRLIMDPPTSANHKGPVERLLITYDLYLAENYKKSQKPPPDYRIIVQDVSSPLPNMKSMGMLDKLYPDQVPFLFAVVSGGTVAFFSVDRVELPRYFRDI